MSLFKHRFNTILEAEAKAPVPAEETPTPEEALKAELDPGTDPNALGAQASAALANVQALKDANAAQQQTEVQDWVAKINDFIAFLNDPQGPSVNNKLHDAPCDTMYDKIASSESKKISRIAVELSGLAQALNGFLIVGNE